jgi:hypothetical protein
MNDSVPSPPSIRHHDGYIRPLTPQKPPIQPDVSVIHVDLDDLRGQSFHQTSSEPPTMYRSSTVIYTKDKHNYVNGGQLRTWSLQQNDDINTNKKSSKSVQRTPSNISNQYTLKNYQQQEENYQVDYQYENRYSGKTHIH